MRGAFCLAFLIFTVCSLKAADTERATGAVGPKSAPVYIPTLDVVREACAKEHPKKCLKRRCVPALSYYAWLTRGEKDTRSPEVKKLLGDFSAPIDPWPDKDDIRRLKEAFGDDWQAARDAMLAAWEVLLYGLETGKTDTLADLFEYPTIFTLETGNIRNMWVRWEVRSKDELKRILFYIVRPLLKESIFRGPRCNTYILCEDGGAYIFSTGESGFNIKRLKNSDNSGRYQLIFNRIIVQSDAFFEDVGKTRHELKRRGRRGISGLYPQPGFGPPRAKADLRK